MAEIFLRANSTSALTFEQLDSNFENINNELIADTNFLNQSTPNNVANTLVLRDNAGSITVNTVTGFLEGSARQVVSNALNSSASTHFLSFVSGQTGNRDVYTDNVLTYVPSTNTLNAGVFSGTAQLTSLNNTGNTTLGDAAADTLTVNATASFIPNVTMAGDLAVNGGDITTVSTTATLFDTTATTVNIARAGTNITIGATTGTTAVRNAMTIQGGTAWHSGNDGSGSGLDADVLDGFQSSQTATNNTVLVRTASGGTEATTGLFSGTLTLTNGTLTTTALTGNLFNTTATTLNIGGAATSIEIGAATGTTDINNTLTVAGNVVYHQGNDGAGSGLDADLLDGYNASVSALANTVVVRDGNGVINGTIAGTTDNANKVAVSDDNTAGTFYLTFVVDTDVDSGYAPLYADTNVGVLSYVPSTRTLTVGTVVGALSGNATTATTLQTTRSINSVGFNGGSDITVEPFVERDDASNATRYLTFVDDATAAYKRLNMDSGLSYNPSSNTLTATTFSGALNGNATTASTLQTARTISLGGDLSGSASFDGGSNITISATVNANSVALGTDTTGNYVGAGATSGNGISGSVSNEGGTFTVTSNATSSNNGNTIVFRDASGNFNAGTITATLSGNASTASALQTARTINGVGFNGTGNITVEPFIEDDEGTNATRYIVFTDNSAAGFKRLNEDSSLTYNPATNEISAGVFSGNLNGNATSANTATTANTANTLTTARTISLAGDVTGSTSFNGGSNVTITATVADDSHNHIISNVDGLQAALDGKLGVGAKAADSNLLDGIDSSNFARTDVGEVFSSNVDASTFRLSGDTIVRWEQGKLVLRGDEPTIYMRDTAHQSAMMHVNGDRWYVLRGGIDTETFTTVNGVWPLEVRLFDNQVHIGGAAFASGGNRLAEMHLGQFDGETNYPIGHTIAVGTSRNENYPRNHVRAVYLSTNNWFYVGQGWPFGGVGTQLPGSWASRGFCSNDDANSSWYIMQRIA